MSDDLATRAARHRNDPSWAGTPPYCLECSVEDEDGVFHDVAFPCDAHRFAEAWQLAEQRANTAEAALAAEQEKLRMLQQAYDDTTTGTFEMLGELLEKYQITPEPCPGGPCVANALIAIDKRLAAEQAKVADIEREFNAPTVAMLRIAHALGISQADLTGCDQPPWIVLADRLEQQVAAEQGALAQVERLADYIMREVPGEPSQSEGAVDTAIRVLGERTRVEGVLDRLLAKEQAERVRLVVLVEKLEQQVAAEQAARGRAEAALAHCRSFLVVLSHPDTWRGPHFEVIQRAVELAKAALAGEEE